MKRLTLTTVIALATAAAMPALADGTDMLRAELQDKLSSLAPDVDVSALSGEQVRALYAGLAGENTQLNRQEMVESIVNDDQYKMDEATFNDMDFSGSNDMRDAVERMLENEPIGDVNVDNLSDEQISALYLELTSGSAADADKVRAIVN